MKKWLWGLSAALVLVLLTVVVFSSAKKGKATSINEDFQIDGSNLVKYYGEDEVCLVPDNVTKIASAAFEGNEYVKRVVLPENLEEIEYNAFAEMNNLERVIVPDSVVRIGSSSFANCPKLSSVYLGKSLCEMGACPFAGCNSLKEVEINDLNDNITCVDGVIYSANRRILYEMLPGRERDYFVFPDSVVSISPYAFWGCDNLLYVTVSDSIETVPAYSFSNAESLLSVSLSFNTKEIGMKAFENCPKLVQVYIPDSCKTIHKTAFDGCGSLSLYTCEGTDAEKFGDENNISVIYKPLYDLNMASIAREKDAEIESIKKQEAAKEAVYDPSSDDSIAYTYIVNNQAVVLMDPSKMQVCSGSDYQSDSGVDYNQLLNDSVSDGIVPENLFYLKNDLEDIEIPDTVNTIGKFSFARTGISEITVPENVETISFGAFYHCENLEKVTIPDSVKVIESNAFAKTPWLENWMENGEGDYLIVGDGILLAYKGDKDNFTMPENVKYVSCDIE